MRRILLLLVFGIVALAMPANAANILFIGDRDNDIPALRSLGDDAMIEWLTLAGNTVTDRDDEGSGSGGGNGATGVDLAAADFVIISASVGSSNVKNNDLGANDADLLAADKPIINMEPGLVDEFGSAPSGGWNFNTYDSITLIASGSPLLAGLTAPGPLQITNSTQDMVAQGAMFPGFENVGVVSATVDGAPIGFAGVNLVTVFDDDQGDGTRIIGLPFGEGSFQDRTAGGQRLFINAILEAGGLVIPEPATCTLLVLGVAGLLWRRRKEVS